MIKIAIDPLKSNDNVFVSCFSDAFVSPEIQVIEYKASRLFLEHPDVVIFHWPNDFFAPLSWKRLIKVFLSLFLMLLSKVVWKTQFVWVAHNVAPHDTKDVNTYTLHPFFYLLDAVIFLSYFSKEQVLETYPRLKDKKILITRHGHYKDTMKTKASIRPLASGRPFRYLFFGQIRPYKNIESLPDIVETGDSTELFIVGKGMNEELVRLIKNKAKKNPYIHLDIKPTLLTDEELEAAVDMADVIILPYKNILNSGSVFFALSRNRPVIAPKTGSLPELQKEVGTDWLYLYDHPLSKETLAEYQKTMTLYNGPQEPNLSTYDWKTIGEALRVFVEKLK